jgi:putative peptidoglycan lipid II flippase
MGTDLKNVPTEVTTKAAPDSDRIVSAALLVMLFFVLSRLAGLGREVVIGAQFGTSADLDAYLAAFRVPDLLFQLAAGGALGSAFIPAFSNYWVQSDRAGAWLLFSRVVNLATLLLIVFAGLSAIFSGWLVQHVIAPGFALEQQALTARLMRWMLISTVVFGASGLIMGALNAVRHFLLPAAAPAMYNVAIILAAWLLSPTWGVYGLVIGVVGGAFAHLVVQLPALWRHGARYRWSLNLRDPGVREVGRLMGPRVLGLFFVQLHFLVNTILASSLAAGSLSALNYAWLLMLLPQGVFAQAIATVAFPTFAAQAAAGRIHALRQTFAQALRLIFFLAIPAAVGLFVLGEALIEALLERGEFGYQSTALVAYALQLYALGLIAHAVIEIAVRAFYALHDTLTPVRVGVLAMAFNIGLSLWWVNWLGYGGLALANSVAATLEMVLLLWLLRGPLEGVEGKRLAFTVGRSLLAAAVMAGVSWLWLSWLETDPVSLSPNAQRWFAVVSGMSVAALVYGVISMIAQSEELRSALRWVLSRLGV